MTSGDRPPIGMVDDDYARAEGRGYADAADWRRAHEDLFTSNGVAKFPRNVAKILSYVKS